MKTYSRSLSLPILSLLILLTILTGNLDSSAQTRPAAAKQSTAKPGTAKQKTSPSPAKSTGAKPASRQTTAPTSGHSTSSKPAPARPANQPGNTPSQQQTTAPAKTATSPTGQYKAADNQPTVSRRVTEKREYGLGFKRNDKLLNVGLGLSSYYYGTPIGVSFEAGVHRDISVGGQLDYNSGRYDDYYYRSSYWGYKAYYLGVRGSYHFNRLLRINTSKVDLYAGAGLGYQSFRWNDRAYGYGYDYRSGLFPNYFIGGKFYFSQKVGAFVELGYTGLSSSRVGIAFKFQ